MHDNLLKKIYYIMLALFVAAAIVGAVLAGIGHAIGYVAVIIGVSACIPVVLELASLFRKERSGSGQGENSQDKN